MSMLSVAAWTCVVSDTLLSRSVAGKMFRNVPDPNPMQNSTVQRMFVLLVAVYTQPVDTNLLAGLLVFRQSINY